MKMTEILQLAKYYALDEEARAKDRDDPQEAAHWERVALEIQIKRDMWDSLDKTRESWFGSV